MGKKILSMPFNSLENILKKIIQDIKLNKNKHLHVLFSPAAASFDKFKNFEDRGNYFNYLVKKTKFIRKIDV